MIKSEDGVVKALPRQGQLARTAMMGSSTILDKSLKMFPSQELEFVLNAMHDTLPQGHNANFNLWKRGRPRCAHSDWRMPKIW